MATDLQGIPGAGSSSVTRRSKRRPPVWRPRRRARRVSWSSLAIAIGFVLLGAFVWSEFWAATRVEVTIAGIADGAELTLAEARELDVVLTVPDLDAESGIVPTLFFDGIEVDESSIEIVDDTVRWRPPPLEEGIHTLAVSIGRPILDDAEFSWTFAVDATPPVIDVASPQPAAQVCEPVEVEGTIETGLRSATVDGLPLEIDEDGSFRLQFDRPPTQPIHLAAEDRSGNRTQAEVVIPVAYPSTQAVHVTAAAWGYQPLRDGVLAMVEAGKLTAVEIDLKDEAGVVGYDTEVKLAHEVGAVRPEYVLPDVVEELHERGVRVIGRIVAFRDPPLASWAWETGRRDWVVQDEDGRALSAYGGFTNVANPRVRAYNHAIAEEALSLGVDEILWDYLRRPEGSLDAMAFPGLEIPDGVTEATAVNQAVVTFLREIADVVRERCAYHGVSVFGIAARNPDAVGQSVPAIARTVDYLAPMLYPSHWVRGEYRVAHPNAQPYDIVDRALADFQRKAAGSGVAVNLWVQDFSLGIPYGPAEVRAQIDAARNRGVNNWILWNATVRYTAEAITPDIVGN